MTTEQERTLRQWLDITQTVIDGGHDIEIAGKTISSVLPIIRKLLDEHEERLSITAAVQRFATTVTSWNDQ